MAHDEEHHHHGSTEPPGMVDILLGAVAFYLLTLLVKALVDAIAPGLMSTNALHEIQISGFLFIFVWWLVGNGIFKPFFEAANEREEQTTGAQRKAAELRREQVDLEAKIAAELETARLKGIRQRDAKVEAAKRKAQELLDAVHRENDSQLEDAAEQLAAQRRVAEQQLVAEAEKLADAVAERALAAESSTQSIH